MQACELFAAAQRARSRHHRLSALQVGEAPPGGRYASLILSAIEVRQGEFSSRRMFLAGGEEPKSRHRGEQKMWYG